MPQLILNDRRLSLLAEPSMRLLDYLRQQTGLTAAKPGCNTGDCGACQVLLGAIAPGERRPRYRVINSCLLSLGQVADCQVITPEALAGEQLTPVQQALVDEGGIQCGYCTPGLVVALTGALLNGQSLNEAVAGNLCRCTGYAGIRRACARLEAAFPRQPRTLPEAAALGLLPLAIAEASEALAAMQVLSLDWSRPEKPLGGETDWAVQQRHHPLADKPGLYLHRIPTLRRLEADASGLTLGAALTVAELQASSLLAADWPELSRFLDRFASPGIRNSATLGGNLVNASPIADLAVVLLALDAELQLEGPQGQRRLPLADFYHGYRQTALRMGELLTAVRLPRARAGQRLHVEKVARREHDDIASVNSALCETAGQQGHFGQVCLSAGGVAPHPLRLDAVAAALSGQPVSRSTLQPALVLLGDAISPIDDVRGSASYKRALLQHQLLAHVLALHPDFDWQECLT